MFGLTEGAFVGMHTATTVVSADPALNNTVGFCIDAGDLGLVFNKRNRCYKSGYWVNYG
jgi:hypothetical protein